MKALSVRHAVMRFGGVTAVDDVDFTVHEGEAVGLLGQNGSGKTTLLNLITGNLKPSAGEISFYGRDLLRLSSREIALAGISRVFQTVQVFPSLTVRENLSLAASNLSAAGRADAAALEQAIERMRLTPYLAHQARDLSYGHQRLLEIAMSLMARARLILFDEPTAGLSEEFVDLVVEQIRDIHAGGTSIILIEHETEVVFKLCTRVSVLNEGRLIADGTPEEIRTNQAVLESYLGD